jgi:hypothetical protein
MRSFPLLGLGIFALSVAAFTACDSVDQNTQTALNTGSGNTKCPFGMPQYKIECCTADGQLNTQLCSNPDTLLDDPLKNTIANGANDITTGAGSLDNARALLGVPREALGSDFGGGLATLANRAIGGATDGGGTPLAQASTLPSSTTDSPNGGLPGSNGGASIAGAGGSLGPPGGEAPAYTPNKDGGPTYAGGGAQGGPTADPQNFFGDLASGGSREPAAQNAAFARGQGPRTMGTADPEDYFTRVSLDESIFKIVTRRYRAKATAWAISQSDATFQQAAQTAVPKR